MRSGLCTLALLLASFTAAHADTIDDFSLTGNGLTVTYSLPATSSYPDFDLFNFFSETATATINGVPGYLVNGDYYDPAFFPYASLILYAPGTVLGAPSLELGGPPFIDFAFVPANNPYPYLPYDVVPTFVPGTYTLDSIGSSGPVPYTLTITQEAPSAVPEPSSLSLLTLGTLGLVILPLSLSTLKVR